MWKILHHIAAKFWRWLLTACSFNRELLIEADLLGPGGCFQVSSSGLQPESFHCVRFVTQLIHHTCRRLHGTPCYSFDTASTIPSESNSRAKCKYRLSSGAKCLKQCGNSRTFCERYTIRTRSVKYARTDILF